VKFLADECIDRQIVDRLRQEGHEVLYVAERDPRITDDEVLNLARGSLTIGFGTKNIPSFLI
jgi:hypothetical protein